VTLALLALSGFIIVLLVFLIVRFAIKYRAGSAADRSNAMHKTWSWELAWTGIPLLLMGGVFVWSGMVFFNLTEAPANARTIYVVGKQWMWKIQHPEGPQEINELHVPAGEPIKLVLRSQDVIHSFFIPAFRVKQDVLPNRYTSLWFQADPPGEYPFLCAQYCGTEHSNMHGRVIVMPPAAFEDWLGAGAPAGAVAGTPGTPQAPLALGGKGAFFRLGCNACHVPDSDVRAPRLDGLWGQEVRLRNGQTVRADEEYIRESILAPNAKIVAGYAAPSLMPTYAGQLSERDLQELVEFTRSLRNGWPQEPNP
jgi:cytochrome c oxidase subunit II